MGQSGDSSAGDQMAHPSGRRSYDKDRRGSRLSSPQTRDGPPAGQATSEGAAHRKTHHSRHRNSADKQSWGAGVGFFRPPLTFHARRSCTQGGGAALPNHLISIMFPILLCSDLTAALALERPHITQAFIQCRKITNSQPPPLKVRNNWALIGFPRQDNPVFTVFIVGDDYI